MKRLYLALLIGFVSFASWPSFASSPIRQPYKFSGTLNGQTVKGRFDTFVNIGQDFYDTAYKAGDTYINVKIRMIDPTQGVLTTESGETIKVKLEACPRLVSQAPDRECL